MSDRVSTSRQIRFEEFSGLNQAAWQTMAQDVDIHPMWLRVMFAAGGWANLIGHAEFTATGNKAGGRTLEDILQTVDPGTGELRKPTRRHLVNEIRKAEQRGLVAQGSTVECLIAPDWLDKPNGRRLTTRTCHTHGIRPKRVRADRAPQAPAGAPVIESMTQKAGPVIESMTPRHRINDGASP